MNACSKTSKILLLCLALALLATAGCKFSRGLEFPCDHGPHFDFGSEWWYFTGIAAADDGTELGFEFTIFKVRGSKSGDFAYLGQVAVSDPEAHAYVYAETLTRPPAAGSAEGVPRVSITDFTYDFTDSRTIFLRAGSDNASLDLALTPCRDVLPHGGDGVIVMADGRRSYYYSLTNLETAGAITVRGQTYAIASGRTWMDHQWGDFTPLSVIWDWFSLRLDDGASLMLFHFRNVLGGTARTTWTYRAADGTVTYGDRFGLEAHRTYEDPGGACRIPLGWTMTVPGLAADLSVEPLFDGQVFFSAMTPDYWEGMCSVAGSVNGSAVTGAAYAELSGYCRLFSQQGD